ncbi:hypothetical protein UFVDC4_00134 [Staphylococcus phage vB_SauM-UFV_DC4]|nr:hypothetical protein UFVDC4_00134 [Staphylococcus phage vB_SauM-UFV_DC4]
MEKKYIRCNSCSSVQEYSEDITSCSECSSENISVIKSPVDLVNEAEVLVTESEMDFLLDYNDYQEYDKKGKSCWFDIYLIKYPRDNTQIKHIVLQNQKGREEDLLIDYAGDDKGGNPIVINDTGSIKTVLNDVDSLSEVVKVRFLSKESTKRRGKEDFGLNSEEYVSFNKDKYNFYNDAKLRTLVKVLESMGNTLFLDSKSDIVWNKIFTEHNVLNSPLFTYQEVMDYNETNLYKEYGDYEFEERLEDVIYDYQLENEIGVFNFLYNKNKGNKPKFTEDREEVYATVTPSMLLSDDFKMSEDHGRINPNVLSLLYFKILEKKLGIRSIELVTYVNSNRDDIILFPVSYNGQGYVLADFKLDSPIVFKNMDDVNKYCAYQFGYDQENENIFKFSVKEVPAEFNFQKAISSNMEIIERFFMKFNENTLNETVLEPESILNEAVGDNKKKRQEIQNKILDVISSLDKDQSNMNKYKTFFDEMNDEEFMRYIKRFVNSNENFYIEVLPNKSEAGFKEVEEALNKLDVPMNEFVYYRHDGNKDDPLRTRYKVPVGYLHVKRLQQLLSKKNAYSLDASTRSMKTGQLTSSDKVASVSNMEASALKAIGAQDILRELMGPRSDSMNAKQELNKNISMYGYSRLEDLPDDLSDKTTLNTTFYYLLGAGIESDLLKDTRPDYDQEE